jgi:hypothetical protein
MEFPSSVANCTVEKSTSNGEPDGRTVGDFIRRSTATPLRWVGLATGASRDPSTWVARPVAGTLLHGPDGRDHIPVDVGLRGHVRRPQLRALTEMSKVVFSSTLKNPLAWANTRLIDQDPVEAVRSMKD